MFSRRPPTQLEIAKTEAIRALRDTSIGSEDYMKMLDIVIRLHAVKEERPFVSRDTLATIGANLLGIIMVIRHEHVGNVITSRAMQMVTKLK